MPPSPKFTKEQVLEAALAIVREEGEEALTARRLGEALGASSRPIFTLFENMDDVKTQLCDVAEQFYSDYCREYDGYSPAFKRLGTMMVSFAQEEPHLFSFLFMGSHGKTLTLDEWTFSPLGEEAVEILKRDYNLDNDTARLLFKETWLHTFSLCVLKVTGAATLSDEEVSNSLSRGFRGLLSLAKTGLIDAVNVPVNKGSKVNGKDVGDVPVLPTE